MNLDLSYVLNPMASILRQDDQIFLFEPESRTYSSLNQSMLELLDRCDGGTSLGEVLCGHESTLGDAFRTLIDLGVLIQRQEVEQIPPPLSSPDLTNGRVGPRLTIFPTTSCNLNCVYCYASGGDVSKSIPVPIYETAMRFYFSSISREREGATSYQEEVVHLSIHGGGEPTADFRLLRSIEGTFSEMASNAGLKSKTSMVSNGTFGPHVREWIIEKNVGVSFSLDGPPDVQNRQRPYRSGKPSFEVIAENIRVLANTGRQVAFRSTVTAQSERAMLATIDLAEELGVAAVHFEPVSITGRCLKAGAETVEAPEPESFASTFLECFLMGLRKDIDVSYSGMRCFDAVHNRFCSACGDNICITPDGDVTTCYEIMSPEDPASHLFFVGRVDVANDTVYIDEDRRAYLRSRVTENLRSCRECFLRFNCAGDCLARTVRYSGGDVFLPDPDRCRIAGLVNTQLIAWVAQGVIEPRIGDRFRVMEFCRKPETV